MQYEKPLIQARLIKRYKRFLADVQLDDGSVVTVHCPNTGSMKNCIVEGSECWLFDSQNAKRKYPLTWELATTPCGHRAGVNTGRANKLVVEGIEKGLVRELKGYDALKTEQKYGEENSRIDILLETPESRCYVEVKSVTLAESNRRGYFPDSISVRASKHLRELISMVEQGHRAVLFFCVQHSGIETVSPAAHIDPVYTETFVQAVNSGVEVIAYTVDMTDTSIALSEPISVSY